MLTIKTHRHLQEIEPFWPQKVSTPFQSFAWHDCWARNFLDQAKIEILTFWDEAKLLAIAPLYKEATGYHLMGTPPNISDYLDLIWATTNPQKINAVLKILFEFLKKSQVSFLHVPETSPTWKYVQKYHESNATIFPEITPQLDCPASWEIYLNNLEKKKKHELKRKMNRLAQIPYEIRYSQTQMEIKTEISNLYLLIKKSLPPKNKFMTKTMQIFFDEFTSSFAANKQILLTQLITTKKTIAAILYFQYHNKLYMYNSGFNPDYQYFSPGLLLAAYNLQYAIEHKFTQLDFLRGNERYKYDLGAQDHFIYNINLKL